MHVIIVGAGPAGLAAALSLHQQSKSTPASPPIRVTVLELRPCIQALGGSINLTPLAMRYLDSLNAGARVRREGIPVSRIDLVSHRTGRPLGSLWDDADAVRVSRQVVVESLLEAARQLAENELRVWYGARITRIDEEGHPAGQGRVVVHLTDTATGRDEILDGDALIGCDGIHSFVRSRYVDPDRAKKYSGIAGAYGYVDVPDDKAAGVAKADDSSLVVDSTMVTAQNGSLLVSYFEPSRTRLYVAAVISAEERTGDVDGWKAIGADKEGLKKDFDQRFNGGKLNGLGELLQRCEEWFFFPVYMLPPGGVWAKGRLFLLGDAAHAMPPQGESTGVAIEDGMLLAHVFSRRASRSVSQMYADYEALRRADIEKLYKDTVWNWNHAGAKGWLQLVLTEWMTPPVLKMMNKRSREQFARDVRKLPLPA